MMNMKTTRGCRLMHSRNKKKQRNSLSRKSFAALIESSDAQYVEPEEGSSPQSRKISESFNCTSCFSDIYEVSGGAFAVEDSVQAADPLLALLGLLLFTFVWSIPEALMITAEMGAMFPENGGYVVWFSLALGPFWDLLQGWMKWLSGVIDNALYPVLLLDYLKSAFPVLEEDFPNSCRFVFDLSSH